MNRTKHRKARDETQDQKQLIRSSESTHTVKHQYTKSTSDFFLLHCIYLSNYVWAHATAHIEGRGDLQESLLSLYHVGPRNQARIMFVGKCLYPQRHLAYPKVCIILFDSPYSSLGKVLNGLSSRVSSNEGKDVKNVICSWRFKSPHTQDTFRTNMDLQRAKKQSIRNGPQKQKWYAASLRCRKQQNPMN